MARVWCQTSDVDKEGSSNALDGIPGAASTLSIARMTVGGKSKVALIEKNQFLRRQAVNLLLEIVELREQLLSRSGQPDSLA